MNTVSRFSNILDPELVACAAKGDRDAFGALVTRHQSAVCGVAYAVCGDFSASEDIAQEAFVASWRQLSTLREPARFRAWVCGIARQLALNLQRRKISRGDQPAESSQADEAVSSEASPIEQAVSEEEKVLLWRALDRLPDSYREPLVLFYREQQSVTAVANALDLSEETVRQRLSRGRVLLREEVSKLIEGVLGRTRPGAAFTLNVLSALPPILGAAGVALSAGTAKAAGTSGGAATASGAASGVALASMISGAVGLLGLYVGYRLWKSPVLTPSTRKVLVRSAVASGATSAILGVIIARFAVTGGRDFISLGLPPAPTLAAFIAAFVIANLVSSYATSRKLVEATRAERDARPEAPNVSFAWSHAGRRYNSRWKIAGFPLVSIAYGADASSGEARGVAKGWLAYGDLAFGGLAACGAVSVAPVAIGGASVGFLSLGGLALGFLSVGGLTAGWNACGGIAIAVNVAMGGMAVASHIAMGGVAVAQTWALGGIAFAQHTNSPEALATVRGDPLLSLGMSLVPYAGWLSLISVPSLLYILHQLKRSARR